MSKYAEYLEAAIGYDAYGLPAATTQFTFGTMPFMAQETENIEDVTEITSVCQSDAIVELEIIDDILKLSFDFSNEMQTLNDMYQDIQSYIAGKDHTTKLLNEYRNTLEMAQSNHNIAKMESIMNKIQAIRVPFFLPTIIPVGYSGKATIGFSADPVFVLFESDELDQRPYKLTMIFNVNSLFIQDGDGIVCSE